MVTYQDCKGGWSKFEKIVASANARLGPKAIEMRRANEISKRIAKTILRLIEEKLQV
jgi:hypothetical protein